LYVIFCREVRDQVRDRRTLFMIFVLPLLLYPLMVYGALQVMAAMEQKPRTVIVVGPEHLPRSFPLVQPDGRRFTPSLFDSPSESELLVVRLEPDTPPWNDPKHAERAIRNGLGSAVMWIPADLPDRLARERDIPIPIKYNSIDEPSKMTSLRLKEML